MQLLSKHSIHRLIILHLINLHNLRHIILLREIPQYRLNKFIQNTLLRLSFPPTSLGRTQQNTFQQGIGLVDVFGDVGVGVETEDVGMDDVGKGLDEVEVLGVGLEVGQAEFLVGAEGVRLVGKDVGVEVVVEQGYD